MTTYSHFSFSLLTYFQNMIPVFFTVNGLQGLVVAYNSIDSCFRNNDADDSRYFRQRHELVKSLVGVRVHDIISYPELFPLFTTIHYLFHFSIVNEDAYVDVVV